MLTADDARALGEVSDRDVGKAVGSKAGIVVQGMAEVHVPESRDAFQPCTGAVTC